MRTLVTFILRLWIDPQAKELALSGSEGPPAWEGQVECVADGARAHVRSAEDLARFIEAQTAARPTPANQASPAGEDLLDDASHR